MFEIRALRSSDRPQWESLWQGYLRFYRQHLPPQVTHLTFNRLLDESMPLQGLVAQRGADLIGFAHFLFHATSWAQADICYLEDLYVDPTARGGGVGRGLIQAVYAAADVASAASVYWMTQEFNAEGRALYDTLAHRTSFIRYER
jgi:GNAT superfamily N-acetyltransferase